MNFEKKKYMLTILLIVPIIAIINIYISKRDSWRIGLIYSIINFIHTTYLIHIFDPLTSQFQYQYMTTYVTLGVDGISIWLIWLTNILMPILILSSYKSIKIMIKPYLYNIFLINFWSIAVFMVLDLLYFYISFEAVLIPMFYLIGYYGSRNKKLSALYQFFLYTLFGSLFLLISIIFIYYLTGSTDYQIILTIPFTYNIQLILWLGFFLSFAIKVPMIPFHIWLPLAHTEGNTGASVILAAILLKLGTYGFIRFSIPLFPDACEYYLPFIAIIAIIGIIYSCISALSLIDLKQIIAYSSIAHMNVSIIGLFTNNIHGLIGSYLYNISHGLVSGGLFLLVGMLYDRYQTRTLKYYRGLIRIMPIYIILFLFFTLSNLSFPGTFGFISEFLIYYGTFLLNPIYLIPVSLVSFLLPLYFLWTYHKIAYGQISNYIPILYQDITIKEYNILLPLIIWIIILGINPSIIINNIENSLLTIIY
jgi:proton-translocating NADH-quinone oxidoreductase chain M